MINVFDYTLGRVVKNKDSNRKSWYVGHICGFKTVSNILYIKVATDFEEIVFVIPKDLKFNETI